MDTDSFVLGVNLDKNHELFSRNSEKAIGGFEIETPKNLSLDEVIF